MANSETPEKPSPDVAQSVEKARRMSCIAVGFALFTLLLRYSAFQPLFGLFETDGLDSRTPYALMMVCAVMAGVVVAHLGCRARPLFEGSAFFIATSALPCGLGIAAYIASRLQFVPLGIVLTVIDSFAFGTGIAVLFLSWAGVLCRTVRGDSRKVLVVLSLSFLLGFLVLLLSFAVLGDNPFLVLAAVPLSAVLLWFAKTGDKDRDAPPISLVPESTFGDPRSVSVLTGVIVAFFMLALSISGSIGTASLGLEVGESPYLRHLVTIAELLLIASLALLTGDARKLLYCVWVVPALLFVAGLVMMRSGNPTILSLGVGLSTAGRSCFELLLLFILVQRPGLPPSSRFMVGLFLVPEAGSILFGRMLLPLLYEAMGMTAQECMGVLTVALPIVLVSVVVAALVRELLASFDAYGAAPVWQDEGETGSGDDPESGCRAWTAVAAASARYGLTQRESTMVLSLVAGYSVAQIAETQVLSVNTVRTHVKNAYRKMGVHSRRELFEMIDAEDKKVRGGEGQQS